MSASRADTILREHLTRFLAWEDAHVGFDAAFASLPSAARGIRPPGLPHSAWELLEHIRLAQRDILDFCRSPTYVAPRWPEAYWPAAAEPRSDGAWGRSLAAVRTDRAALQALALDPGCDLLAALPHGTGQTVLREVLLAGDHAAYHVGQVVLVRRALDVWPAR